MNEINTNNGIYKYIEILFENGKKKINIEVSKNNLLSLKECFDKGRLSFGLIYGTLLGAIRENNFIEHDEDTDIFILKEHELILIELLFELRKYGFEVARYTPKLLSVIKDGEYIDIYFFQKYGKNTRECEGYIIKSSFLENLVEYKFLGEIFNIPENPKKLLMHLYGNDWETPKENTPASNYGLYLKIKFLIKNNSQTLFKLISWIKTKLNVLYKHKN